MPGIESTIQFTELTEIVGDVDTPCDYSDQWGQCPNEPARWILHRVPCPCGKGGAVLACAPCKELRLTTEGGVKCDCGERFIPARTAYSLIEPLS